MYTTNYQSKNYFDGCAGFDSKGGYHGKGGHGGDQIIISPKRLQEEMTFHSSSPKNHFNKFGCSIYDKKFNES